MDAMGVETATLVTQDWGVRAAQGVAALHPERVERLVTFGGYAIAWDEGGPPPPYAVMQTLWYHHLLNMPFAVVILRGDAEGFARHLHSCDCSVARVVLMRRFAHHAASGPSRGIMHVFG